MRRIGADENDRKEKTEAATLFAFCPFRSARIRCICVIRGPLSFGFSVSLWFISSSGSKTNHGRSLPTMTTTDHDAFLRAILESPDDDAPRLICADGWTTTATPTGPSSSASSAPWPGRQPMAGAARSRSGSWNCSTAAATTGPARSGASSRASASGAASSARSASAASTSRKTRRRSCAAPVQEVQLYWGAEHPAEREPIGPRLRLPRPGAVARAPPRRQLPRQRRHPGAGRV